MNRITRTLAALFMAGAVLAPAAFAESAAKPDGAGKGKHGRKAFETVDTNKDGGITVAELKAAWANNPRRQARADKMFGFVDTNKDGKLDKTEWEARKGPRGHGGWRRNKDGKGRQNGQGQNGQGQN